MSIGGPGQPGSGRKDPVLQRVPKPALAAESTATEPGTASGAVTDAPAAIPAPAAARSPLEMSPIFGPDAAERLIKSEVRAAAEPRPHEDDACDSVVAIYESLGRLWAFAIPMWLLPRRLRGSWWLGPIISGSLPIVINGLLFAIPGHVAVRTTTAWGWLAIFAGTQIGSLAAGRLLWGRLVRDMPLIADMIPDEQADHKLARWVRRAYSIPGQTFVGCAVAVLGTFVLWHSSRVVIHAGLELGAMSYLSVAWTSFMGGLLLYAFVLNTLFTLMLSKCGPLVLDPWDPASTPGLRTLSLGYIYCMSFIIVLSAGLEVAATEVPGYRESGVLSFFVVCFPIFAVLCGLFVMILPHVLIFHMTYLNKLQTRAIIDQQIGDLQASIAGDHGRLVTLIWLRSQVFNGPGIPIRVPWLVPLTAALVGPLAGFLLTIK
jgi:hypothetical protein